MMAIIGKYGLAGLMIFIAGFGLGQKVEKNTFETFKQELEKAHFQQKIRNVMQFESQRRENEEVKNELEANIKKSGDSYDTISRRLRDRESSTGSMSKDGGATCGNDDPAGDYRLLNLLRAAELQALRLKGCQAILEKTYQKFK